MNLLRRLRDRLEHLWLRRWVTSPRMKATGLHLRLDLALPGESIRAEADFSFRPQVKSRVMACGMGPAALRAVTWKGRTIRARSNPPFLVLKFPEKLEPFVETKIQLRYGYQPDRYGTIVQPVTREDCPQRIWLTCRRPLLAVTQGRLVQGVEKPPLRVYEWESPRSRKLNAIAAAVRSFRKETSGGMTVWLHLHDDSVDRAPRILDLIIEILDEGARSHRRELPYSDLHVLESDDPRQEAFDSPGLVVVPRGSFRVDDKPTVYGILAPELNKEWGRDALRLHPRR